MNEDMRKGAVGAGIVALVVFMLFCLIFGVHRDLQVENARLKVALEYAGDRTPN